MTSADARDEPEFGGLVALYTAAMPPPRMLGQGVQASAACIGASEIDTTQGVRRNANGGRPVTFALIRYGVRRTVAASTTLQQGILTCSKTARRKRVNAGERRVAKKPPGPKAEALGIALRAVRKRIGLSMADVASRLEWSESLVSRLETGNRNIDAEEVSALLAIYGVIGTERDQLMAMARTPDEDSWLDPSLPGLPPESVRLATYERQATGVTDWAPLLVPGLLQTMEYGRAFMLADGIPEGDIGGRLMARQRRQEALKDIPYTAYIDASVLRREIGGPRVLRRQLEHLIETAEDDNAVKIRCTSGKTDGHSGLVGPFVLLEFDQRAPVVHVELARSGVFLTGPVDSRVYVDTVTRLESISHDVEESLRLLREAAGAIGSENDGQGEPRDLA